MTTPEPTEAPEKDAVMSDLAQAWDAGWCAGVAAIGQFDGFPERRKVNPYRPCAGCDEVGESCRSVACPAVVDAAVRASAGEPKRVIRPGKVAP